MSRILPTILLATSALGVLGCGGTDGGPGCDLAAVTEHEARWGDDPAALEWCGTNGCITREAALCVAERVAVGPENQEQSASLVVREIEGESSVVWAVTRHGSVSRADGQDLLWYASATLDAASGQVVSRNESTSLDPVW